MKRTYEVMNIPHGQLHPDWGIGGGGAELGRRAHADEYYVIEGAGKVYGMAGAEKAVATLLYAFAGKIPPKGASTN